jgi:hypothetical protein
LEEPLLELKEPKIFMKELVFEVKHTPLPSPPLPLRPRFEWGTLATVAMKRHEVAHFQTN